MQAELAAQQPVADEAEQRRVQLQRIREEERRRHEQMMMAQQSTDEADMQQFQLHP